MRTKTIEIKTFSELTTVEQDKAVAVCSDWNTGERYWSEAVIEDAETVAGLLGINISNVFFSGFCSQGDGACFEGSFEHRKGATQLVQEYAPKDKTLHRIASEFSALHRTTFYSTTGKVTHHGHYYHERSMRVDVRADYGCKDDGPWLELFADFASWIYERLEEEYDYQNSFEAIAESLAANDVEFEVDGGSVTLAYP